MCLALATIAYCATSWAFIILVAAVAIAPEERSAPALLEAASSTAEWEPSKEKPAITKGIAGSRM